jgi:hypothetical protein
MAEKPNIGIYQIYFDEKSRRNCYSEIEKYRNQGWNSYNNSNKLTEFFENSPISDLIIRNKHVNYEYFGVFSHDIRKEINFKEDNMVFSPDSLRRIIEKNDNIDVFAFEKRRKNPNIIKQAEDYHPGFIKLIQSILEETKFLPDIPKKLDRVVLFNHFIARSEIYDQYVNELLLPAMRVLKEIPEAYNDAKYVKIPDQETKQRFVKAFGKPYYPYHPFVCERLPSLFLHKYRYSFKQIF